MLEIKKKSKCLALLAVLLFIAGTMSATLAWVSDSQKAKIDSDELLISKTDNLMVSLDGENYYGSIDVSNNSIFKIANLKDFSGDGINLYSAVIDPYTKQAQATGWQYIRSDLINGVISQEEKDVLDANNKNKTYYSYDIYFKSTVPLNVYLYKDSFVTPSTKEMNKLAGDTNTYNLFVKRTATYDPNSNKTTYSYETEDGLIGIATTASEKENFETTKLPIIYNRSIYSNDFDDDIDLVRFQNGNYVSMQTMYSANYISSSIRVAFIDDQKMEGTQPKDYDYKQIIPSTGKVSDYINSRLRMIWAPNPECRMTKTYNQTTDSSTYDFDIVNLEETYYDSNNHKIGKSVTYSNGAKYYYKFNQVDDTSSSEFLLFVKGDTYYKLDGTKISDVQSQNVVDYNNLKNNLDSSKTTTNKLDRTGARTIDGSSVSDNRFYSYDGHTATPSSIPTQLFANDLPSSADNFDNYSIISTLKLSETSEYYEGKTTIVMWVEGSDPEASIALTAGNGAGLSESSGVARIAYCLSFIGKEIPNTNEE